MLFQDVLLCQRVVCLRVFPFLSPLDGPLGHPRVYLNLVRALPCAAVLMLVG
jgi:hypothetical protein